MCFRFWGDLRGFSGESGETPAGAQNGQFGAHLAGNEKGIPTGDLSAPTGLRPQTSGAFAGGNGRATERVRDAVCGGTRDAESVMPRMPASRLSGHRPTPAPDFRRFSGQKTRPTFKERRAIL